MKTPYFFMEAPPFTPPPSILDTIKNLWKFTLRPAPIKREHNVVEVKLPLIFQILLIELVVLTVLLLLLSYLYKAMGLQVQGKEQVWALVVNKPFLLLFVTFVLFAPLKEEIVFRLPLEYSGVFLVAALATFLFHYGPALIIRTQTSLPALLVILASITAFVVAFLNQKS
ncbi:hypothetical protein GCM10028895_18570 [Pontibacter rugosus]